MNWLRFDSLFRVGVSPFYWSCRLIVLADVAHELEPQVGKRVKDATSDNVALDFGEPVFNLVQPRGISRRVMDADIDVGSRKAATNFVLCAERLSAMTWIDLPVGCEATISSRKLTNSELVWRLAVLPRISPLRVSKAA